MNLLHSQSTFCASLELSEFMRLREHISVKAFTAGLQYMYFLLHFMQLLCKSKRKEKVLMSEFKVIEIKRSVYENNDREAELVREQLKKDKTFLLNLMSSPGSGKTTTLKATISALKDEYKIGVMEADIDSDVDARAIEEAGAKSIQLHTGGMCHLDAGMTKQGLDSFGATDYEFVVLENVGNLVCPAEFDTGASKNAMILSVPEGDDKPLKYPLMFSVCDCVLINKIDTKSVFDFDDAAVVERIKKINPTAEIFFVSAKTGEGMDNWFNWLRRQIDDWNKD